MPVPSGYGKSGLDYTICINGRFVAIETKRPGEWLTPRQRQTVIRILTAGGKVFVISGEEGLASFRSWIETCRDTVPPAGTNCRPVNR